MFARRSEAAGLAAAFLGTFIALLDLTIVTVALPSIQESLATDLTGVQWIVDSFALCLAAFLLSGGLLGDRLGRKRTYLGAIAIFVAGSLACALAGDLGLLIAGRAVQGLAAAVIVPGALSLIGRTTTDPGERGRLMGWWGMVASLAVVTGPLLGGILVDTLGWQSIFLVNAPLGAIIVVAGLLGLSESSDPEHAALDPAGQVLGVILLGSLAYGAIEARDFAVSALPVTIAAAVFAASLAGFVVVEHHITRPMVPLSLFRNPQFSVVTAASVALGFGANGAFFLVTLYLQQVRGNSAWTTGLLLLPMTVAIMPSSILAGRLTGRYGPRHPLLIGYLLTGAALAGLAVVSTNTSYLLMSALFVVCGLGQGLAIVPAPAAVLQVVPRERSGVGAAMVSAARQTGTALGFAVLGTLVNVQLVKGARPPADAFVAGLRTSLLIAGATILIAALALAVSPGRWTATPITDPHSS